MEKSEEQTLKVLRFWGPVETKAFVVLLLILLASSYYRSLQITLSVLAGGAVAVFSFWSLRRSIEGVIQQQKESGSALRTGFLILKYPLLFAILAFLILKTPLHLIAWVVGFLSLVIAIVLEGLMPAKN